MLRKVSYDSVADDENNNDSEDFFTDISVRRKVACIVLITLLSLSLVFDRTTIDGVLPKLKEYFSINDSTTSLLQTAASIFSSCFLLVLGVIGDKMARKRLLTFLPLLWLVLVLVSMAIPPSLFWVFLLLRSFSSVGATAVTVLSPVLVADFFQGPSRGRALVLLSLVPFVASIVSLTASSWLLTSSLPWQLSLLPAPPFALPLILLLLCLLPGKDHHRPSSSRITLSSLHKDLKTIFSIRTFVFMMVASSLSGLFTRAISFWLPTILFTGYSSVGSSLFFGLSFPVVLMVSLMSTMVSLIIGMPVLLGVAEWWGGRRFSRALPVTASLCSSLSTLSMMALVPSFVINFPLSIVLGGVHGFFSGGAAVLSTQIQLDVVPSRLRASSMALGSLLLGLVDSPAALLLGAVADFFRGDAVDNDTSFGAYVSAVFVLLLVGLVAAVLIGLSALSYPGDKERVEGGEASPLLPRGRTESVLQRALSMRKPTLELVD